MTNKIVAIQGNHPASLNPLTDSTIFLAHEIQKKNEADRIKREQERQKKIKEEEERREREVKEAELKRIQDIERQRAENDRIRMEMEAKERQAQIDEESRRLDSVKSGELAVYKTMISQKIKRNSLASLLATMHE